MAEKEVLIIGAGVAGLAAGCYAQMNGFRSQIFELHHLPGGLCTAWERKNYIVDGCIHYLFGSGEGQPFHDVWQELGAVPDTEFVNHEELMRVIGPDGRELIAYADPNRLVEHMTALSKADAERIEAFAEGIAQFTQFDMTLLQQEPRALMGPQALARLGRQVLPYALPMAQWGTLTAAEFAARFEDPFLRAAIPHLFGWPDIPMMVGISLLAYMHNGNAGFPGGGSLKFAEKIAKRYEELGGTIHYQAQVEKILVENDRAVGIRLYNDAVIRGDYVVSAADGRNTIFHLLDGAYTDRAVRRMYDGRLPLHTQTQVSLGVRRDLSGTPHWATYLLPQPALIAGAPRETINVKHYCFDPTLAPPGCSVVVVAMEDRYDYWQRIYGRRLYDTEQLQVADIVIDQLERIHPGLGADIEMKDVATPVSYERYTGNWQGATCGFLLTDKTMVMMIQGVPQTLPGLDNFYMAGQWVQPGGSVPVVAMSGRNVVQMLCAAEGQEFVTA
jgi:phytoene dehydrogenase-like protein